jgi:hypothetical protein
MGMRNLRSKTIAEVVAATAAGGAATYEHAYPNCTVNICGHGVTVAGNIRTRVTELASAVSSSAARTVAPGSLP